ncbi:MAG TPA: TonB family protein [Pyrinomonadaceae bacterium]|nr:TonB family protein [Pyrinomonadaceae bacterium]
MKTTLAIALLALTLSLCNLIGKRGNTNTNSNSRSSGEIAESSPATSPAEQSSNRTIDAPPPPITQSAPRTAAPPSSLPAVNHNSAASVPPPLKPGPVKTISGGVLNGKAISKPQPAYPAIAKAARASGTVTVQVLVDEQGKVVSANAVSGHPLLQQSAVQAARQARFSPTLLSGQPVKVTGVITYNFVLQ